VAHAHPHDHEHHEGHDHAHDHAHDHETPREHPHDHGHHHHGIGATTRALTLTLALTLSFFVVEVVVGLMSGSLSLLADAGHMFTDSSALLLALVVARIARRPRTPSKTYGYRRAEIIGALVNSGAMLVMSALILVEAVQRLRAPHPIAGSSMLLTAVCGLAVNLLSVFFLARSGDRGLNMRAALLHVIGDALGSIAAIAAGIGVVYFGFLAGDAVASFAIALVMGVGALRLVREAADILMEGSPANLDPRVLTRTILDTPGVSEVHDLHVWCLTPNEPMLTAHVVLTGSAHGTDVARRVGERLRSEYGLHHVTIQPEAAEQPLVRLRVRSDGKKM
jgi:cobalt-zinc-cadmium efflux system protein